MTRAGHRRAAPGGRGRRRGSAQRAQSRRRPARPRSGPTARRSRRPTLRRRCSRSSPPANEIEGKPYKYGGGHGKWDDSGYDCSGSVSYALHGAGLLDDALPSGAFTTLGRAGQGTWVTIYANGGHMYMTVAGLRFDTSARRQVGGRWTTESRSPSGYTVRHPEGSRPMRRLLATLAGLAAGTASPWRSRAAGAQARRAVRRRQAGDAVPAGQQPADAGRRGQGQPRGLARDQRRLLEGDRRRATVRGRLAERRAARPPRQRRHPRRRRRRRDLGRLGPRRQQPRPARSPVRRGRRRLDLLEPRTNTIRAAVATTSSGRFTGGAPSTAGPATTPSASATATSTASRTANEGSGEARGPHRDSLRRPVCGGGPRACTQRPRPVRARPAGRAVRARQRPADPGRRRQGEP